MSEAPNGADHLRFLPRRVRRLIQRRGIPELSTLKKVKQPQREKESKSSVVLTTIFTAMLTTIASQFVIEIFSLNEPNLVYIGGLPETPTLEVQFGDRPRSEVDILEASISQRFRNWGLKRGHVEKVVVTQVGVNELMPNKVSEPECDKTAIWAFQSKEVKCRFFITVDFPNEFPKIMRCRTIFYDPGGHEIYVQDLHIRRSVNGKFEVSN